MTYKEEKSNLTDVRIPEAFRWAVMQRREAELLIYQIVAECLETFEDVEVRFDKKDGDGLYKSLRSLQREGLFDGNALHYTEDENTATLSCDFNLYGIREDLADMSDKVFGTIAMEDIEAYLLSDDMEVSAKVQARESAIQKVKHVGEVNSQAEPKKDN